MKKIESTIVLLILFYILLIPHNVNAADKDVKVNIDKDYTNCMFTIDLENPGNYTGKIICPENDEFECSIIDEDTLTCQIENCIKGEWIVRVSNNEIEEIGKVKVTVSTSTTRETDVVDNISVGKDIVGLKIFFKDDSIVAEWTDDTCGNVNILVTNVDTAEIIDNTTVSEKKYQCELDPSVKKISVSIVPSSSASITGAAINYTYDVNNHPDAAVTFPSNPYSNNDTVPVHVEMHEDYGIYVEDNGEKILEEDIMKAGNYDFDIPLSIDGTNEIMFYIVDNQGNMRSTKSTIIKDTIAPVLSMDENYNNLKTYNDTYVISGTVSDFSVLKINDMEITVSTDGTFEYECKLHSGNNFNTILALDEAGNESEVTFNIIMQEEQKRIGINPILLFLITIVVLFVFLNRRKIRMKNESEKSKSHIHTVGQTEKSKSESVEYDTFNAVERSMDFSDENELVSADEPDISKSTNRTVRYKRKIEKEQDENYSDIDTAECVTKKETYLATDETEKDSTIGRNKRFLCKVVLSCILVVLLTGIICRTVVFIGYVPTESMNPTIKENALFIANRLAYAKKEPQRGDIIFFYKKDAGNENYCKRIVGIPGDTIEFSDGYVFINGELLDESKYLDIDVETNSSKSFTVPKDEYFVLGDNREASLDSRYWEEPYVKIRDITAKALFIFN